MRESSASSRCRRPSANTRMSAVEVERRRTHRPRRDRRVRQMRCVAHAASRLPSLPHAHRGRDFERLDTSVVRVPTGSDVVVADELGVHHGEHRPTPCATAPGRQPGDDVCNRHRRLLAVERDVDQVDRRTPSASIAVADRPRPERAEQVTARDRDGHAALVGEHRCQRRIGGRRSASRRAAAPATPTGPLRDRHPAAAPSSTTPRRAPIDGFGRSPAHGGVRRHRRHLAQQVDQLLHRPNEIAAGQLLFVDDLGETLPGDPGMGHGGERRVRSAMLAETDRSLAGPEVFAERVEPLPSAADLLRGEPGGSGRLGAAMLVHDAGDDRSEVGRHRDRRGARRAASRRPGDRSRGRSRRASRRPR